MGSKTHGWDDGDYSRWVAIGPTGNAYKLNGGDPADHTAVHYRHERQDITACKFQLAYLQMQNRSASTLTVGAGVRIHSAAWVAGDFLWSTNTFNDDTTDAQDAGASDFLMERSVASGTAAASSGFMVGCRHKFNCISINVTQASVGGAPSPVRIFRYSTSAASPSNWVQLPNAHLYVPPTSSGQWAVGEQLVWWPMQNDWDQSPSDGYHAAGASAGYYWVQILSTTAASAAASAGTISVADLPFTIESLADNALYEPTLGGMYVPMNPAGDAFVTAWSAASAGNTVVAMLRARG